MTDKNGTIAQALRDVDDRVDEIMKDIPYVDKTGTDEKPNPMRDVYQEFPLAMTEIAKCTAYGATKHPPRGWQTFDSEYGIVYHTGKLGRHLLAEETEGMFNETDGGLLHPAQVAWNALARLEHILRIVRSFSALKT